MYKIVKEESVNKEFLEWLTCPFIRQSDYDSTGN